MVQSNGWDAVGTVVSLSQVYGDGIGMEKIIIGDGSGMGLIFTIVSLLVRD